MPPGDVNQPSFPRAEARGRARSWGQGTGSTKNVSEHQQLIRSPENTAGAQDLARKEENLCVGQHCAGQAGEAAGAGWLGDTDPLAGGGQR